MIRLKQELLLRRKCLRPKCLIVRKKGSKNMTISEIPEELKVKRQQLDQLDLQIVDLLAKRFEITQKVGEVKAAYSLEALDGNRETEKLRSLKDYSAKFGLSGSLVESLFALIMKEVVANHRELR